MLTKYLCSTIWFKLNAASFFKRKRKLVSYLWRPLQCSVTVWVALEPCRAALNLAVCVPCGAAAPEAFSQQAHSGLSRADPIKSYNMGSDKTPVGMAERGGGTSPAGFVFLIPFYFETWSGTAESNKRQYAFCERGSDWNSIALCKLVLL